MFCETHRAGQVLAVVSNSLYHRTVGIGKQPPGKKHFCHYLTMMVMMMMMMKVWHGWETIRDATIAVQVCGKLSMC